MSIIAAGADDLTLKLTKGTGLFSGTFIHPVSTEKVKIRGAILRERSSGLGFFLDTGVSGSATLEPDDDP